MSGRPPTKPDQSTLRGRVAAAIRRRRLRKKLSIEAAVGCPAVTWYSWEAGTRLPSQEKLAAIAAALGCTARRLIPE